MEPHTIKSVSQKVYNEMDNIKEAVRLGVHLVMPRFLASWDVDVGLTFGAVIANHVPMLSNLLLSASQTTRACKENTVKDSKIICSYVFLLQLRTTRTEQTMEQGADSTTI